MVLARKESLEEAKRQGQPAGNTVLRRAFAALRERRAPLPKGCEITCALIRVTALDQLQREACLGFRCSTTGAPRALTTPKAPETAARVTELTHRLATRRLHAHQAWSMTRLLPTCPSSNDCSTSPAELPKVVSACLDKAFLSAIAEWT